MGRPARLPEDPQVGASLQGWRLQRRQVIEPDVLVHDSMAGGGGRSRTPPDILLPMAKPGSQTLLDLRAARLFIQLDDAQLARIAAIARPVLLPAEHTLFLQGDPASAFYLLSEGRLKVFKLLRDGRTATIRHVEAGQTFAEAALFREEYPSSTEMLTEPQVAVNLLAAMAHLLGLLNRRVEELLLPVPARLARYLLALADAQLEPPAVRPAAAGKPASPRVVKLPTSKRELAARLGTVPETLSRTFDRLKRAEVIRMSGDHELIEILSFEKLHRLAQD